MNNQPIEELLPKSDWSIYRLVRMAANRTTELADGSASLIKKSGTDKLTTIALDEISQGKIIYKGIAEQFLQDQKAEIKQDEIEEE